VHEQCHQRSVQGGVYLLYLRSFAFKYRYILYKQSELSARHKGYASLPLKEDGGRQSREDDHKCQISRDPPRTKQTQAYASRGAWNKHPVRLRARAACMNNDQGKCVQ
jgi:hypothetical protein